MKLNINFIFIIIAKKTHNGKVCFSIITKISLRWPKEPALKSPLTF